jgi:Icc-related predicted phosphoesterase
MRIVAMSDTHGHHRELDVPDGDVLVHAGDFLLDSLDNVMFDDFIKWFEAQPHRHKLLVPGNHDGLLQYENSMFELGNICFDGVQFGCNSYTPIHKIKWHYQHERDSEQAYATMSYVDPADVLVTHGPSYGVADKTARGNHAGCRAIDAWVTKHQPQVHIHGHIHHSHGHYKNGETDVYNVAVLDDNYNLVHEPTVIDL